MPQLPDHQAGVNSLPRWSPDNLGGGYVYDPRNYDPRDYQKFKEARAKADKERQAKAERDLKQAMKDAAKAVQDKFKSQVKKTQPTREQYKRAALAGRVLTIDLPSTCFASVTWEAIDDEGNGIVTGEFHRGGQLVYDADMDIDTFLDWASDDSVGGWYNANDPF